MRERMKWFQWLVKVAAKRGRGRPRTFPVMKWLHFLLMVGALFLGSAGQAQDRNRKGIPALEGAPEPVASPAVPKGYVLMPNDQVHIQVFRESELETRARISPNGTIRFPLLGEVKIGGMTKEQAEMHIQKELQKDYLVRPHVSLTIVDYTKRKFTILGEVNKPGIYEIPGEETVTILDAIGMAGGTTANAKLNNVTIKRAVGGGEKKILNVDAAAMIKNPNAKPIEILPGDNIQVHQSVF